MPTMTPGARMRRGVAIAVGAAVLVAAVAGVGLAVTGRSVEAVSPRVAVVPAEYRDVIREAAQRCQAVPLEVFAAQIAAESGWDPQARSSAGARGIAQFMPKVWRQYGIDANGDGEASVWDPVDAIHSAAELNCLNRRLVKGASGNRLRNTLAAYNAGYGAVLRYDGVPPYPETEAYVDRIMTLSRTIII